MAVPQRSVISDGVIPTVLNVSPSTCSAMTKIMIGDVQFSTNGKELTIARGNEQKLTLLLDQKGVENLIEFVTSLAECEFNRRQTFRVAVWSSSGLSVQIRKNKSLVSVRPTSLSISGIFVELAPDDWIDLALGDQLEVVLEFEGQKHSQRVVVRHREPNGYGLQFCASMATEQIDRLPEITQIVMKLQRSLLARFKRLSEDCD
jgi:hypothetical protein